jgi:cellulase/cellobiase CelA1
MLLPKWELSCGCKLNTSWIRSANLIANLNSDTIARVPLVATMLTETPCTDIMGIVVYDLPGRDCAAKASNGELATGSLAKYKSDYIDRKLR